MCTGSTLFRQPIGRLPDYLTNTWSITMEQCWKMYLVAESYMFMWCTFLFMCLCVMCVLRLWKPGILSLFQLLNKGFSAVGGWQTDQVSFLWSASLTLINKSSIADRSSLAISVNEADHKKLKTLNKSYIADWS